MNILILGNINSKCSKLINLAKKYNIEVVVCNEIKQAIETFSIKNIQCCFFDVDLGCADYFKAVNNAKINMPTIILGQSTDMKKAVAGIRMGAIEFLSFPLNEDMLKPILDSIKKEKSTGPIAKDPASLSLLEMAGKFANSNATVLLRGESGTGKEVFSRFVHDKSPRAEKNFVSVNCAAIPENLLESELFGHEKGSFSGALTKRIGKFEQANGGTLLLDEISEMDISLQAKLLRAIQERVIDPIGSSSPVEIDIRLIATTNRDLETEVAEGNFREDLYFRLNVVALDLIPLRSRKQDILPLSQFFANKYAKQNGIEAEVEFTEEAIQKLESCYWKGNVRELENTIHRAIIMMSSNTINADDVIISPMSLRMMEDKSEKEIGQVNFNMSAANAYGAINNLSANTNATITQQNPILGRTIQSVEKDLILSTLAYCAGNREHAANVLGISIVTLRDKLKAYEKEFNL